MRQIRRRANRVGEGCKAHNITKRGANSGALFHVQNAAFFVFCIWYSSYITAVNRRQNTRCFDVVRAAPDTVASSKGAGGLILHFAVLFRVPISYEVSENSHHHFFQPRSKFCVAYNRLYSAIFLFVHLELTPFRLPSFKEKRSKPRRIGFYF